MIKSKKKIKTGKGKETQVKQTESIFNDIIEENFANLNRDAYQCTRSIQATKYTGPEKNVPPDTS